MYNDLYNYFTDVAMEYMYVKYYSTPCWVDATPSVTTLVHETAAAIATVTAAADARSLSRHAGVEPRHIHATQFWEESLSNRIHLTLLHRRPCLYMHTYTWASYIHVLHMYMYNLP